jgi:hypothetical protein
MRKCRHLPRSIVSICDSTIGETSEDYSIRDSDPDLLQVIAESYKSPKQGQKNSLENDGPGREILYDGHDIDQRQKLIDKLLEELDHRTNAVKKVGQDLYRLREKNAENEVKEPYSYIRQ